MSNYQMLDENHPVNQGIKAKELGRGSITGNQDNPNVVELKQPTAPAVEEVKVEDKNKSIELDLSFTATQWAALTRRGIQRKLEIKDIIQIIVDEALEGTIGKAFITSPGGNKPMIKGPSFYKGGEY